MDILYSTDDSFGAGDPEQKVGANFIHFGFLTSAIKADFIEANVVQFDNFRLFSHPVDESRMAGIFVVKSDRFFYAFLFCRRH